MTKKAEFDDSHDFPDIVAPRPAPSQAYLDAVLSDDVKKALADREASKKATKVAA